VESEKHGRRAKLSWLGINSRSLTGTSGIESPLTANSLPSYLNRFVAERSQRQTTINYPTIVLDIPFVSLRRSTEKYLRTQRCGLPWIRARIRSFGSHPHYPKMYSVNTMTSEQRNDSPKLSGSPSSDVMLLLLMLICFTQKICRSPMSCHLPEMSKIPQLQQVILSASEMESRRTMSLPPCANVSRANSWRHISANKTRYRVR
jgi:hypothetical protein